jgi:hypothetical protein
MSSPLSMDRPVFKSIQRARVSHADAICAGETLEFACALDGSTDAAIKDADKTIVHSCDIRLAVGAGWSAARWYEPIVFFIFPPARLVPMSDAGSIDLLYSQRVRYPAGGSNTRNGGYCRGKEGRALAGGQPISLICAATKV